MDKSKRMQKQRRDLCEMKGRLFLTVPDGKLVSAWGKKGCFFGYGLRGHTKVT